MELDKEMTIFVLRIPIGKTDQKKPAKTAFFLVVNVNKLEKSSRATPTLLDQAQELGFKRIKLLESPPYAVWHFCGKQRKSESILKWLKQANIPILHTHEILSIFYPKLRTTNPSQSATSKEEKPNAN